MSTTWYSLTFSNIPLTNNYSVSYYFSVLSGLVTGIYRYDTIGVNILAPQTLFGNNSGSDNVFTVGTSSFSRTAGTNFNDPILYNNVVAGIPTATNYFNFFSGTNGNASIYYWRNTGNTGGYLNVTTSIVTISSPPTNTSSYNINNTNLLYYYPFNVDFLDYKTGTGTSNSTTTNVTISTANTKLTNGSILFPGSTGTSQLVQIPSTTLTTNGVTIAFWAKITLQSGVSPQFVFDFASGAAVNTVGMWLSGTGAFQLMLYNASSVGNSYSLNYTLLDSNWHHYCVTASQTSGVWSFYVDGVSIAVSITSYPTTAAMTTPYIGANHLGNANINGNMNQFLVFNRVITADEIYFLVNNPSQVGFSSSVTSIPILPYPCFLEGSKILCLDPISDVESYVPVETLRPGDLVRTSLNGHKAVFHIGKRTLPNPAKDPEPRNRLYRFPCRISPKMTEDLCITGEHCLLHKKLSHELEEQVRRHMGDIYITEYQYRVPACLDNRAIPYSDYNDSKEPVTIWHFALENHNPYHNYGVYANGLLVESCSIQYLTEMANMELVE